ncbi:MAG: iron complex outermembrane receptor protein [Sphingobacteriales bacterium]
MGIQHKHLILIALAISLVSCASAQTIRGVIKDKVSDELLFATSIVEKGTNNGTTTDINGRFEIRVNGTPAILQVFYLGYANKEIPIASGQTFVEIKLEENSIMGEEVVVSASRISEKLQESPVTIERLGIQEIKETPAANFYDGLANLKGVDFTSASLAFKVINTRGFNSTAPVRTLQVIDGMDNQAPALNFSLGNFLGANEIDVRTVDIVVGANSATYGPNAFNGVIDIQTKDAFQYPGLTVQVKGGSRELFDGAIRYAKPFYNNKAAIKLNAAYLRADDWVAGNLDPTEGSVNGPNTNAGYDAVNIYGDESRFEFTQGLLNVAQRTKFGDTSFSVYRTGYNEIDVADYDTRNLKLNGTVYYKLTPDITASYFYNFGTGTTVYQGENRLSINNVLFQQHKGEVKGKRFFIRGYKTIEDAGDSYDVVFTANKLLEESKSLGDWNRHFIRGFRGYMDSTSAPTQGTNEYDQWMEEGQLNARNFADTFTASGAFQKYYVPGTERYDEAFNKIISNSSFLDGGSRFQDNSSLKHLQGEYNLNPSALIDGFPKDFRVGGSIRQYNPRSEGTIFSDTLLINPDGSTSENLIKVRELGVYINTNKELFDERLNLIASVRSDYHSNFDPNISPSFSAVIKPTQNNTFRITASSAIRNPTLIDQYQYYNLGQVLLIGNIAGDSLILLQDYLNNITSSQPDTLLSYITPVKPEKVKTIEFGYKGILFKRLYTDVSYYYSSYKDFLGTVIAVVSPTENGNQFPPDVRRLATNSKTKVTTQGFSIGLNYYFLDKYSVSGNYTFTELTKQDESDPLIPAYNTPRNKFNLGFGGRNVYKKLGFQVGYKWVQSFRFEGSPQFTGGIDSYYLIDAQINYQITALRTTAKIGVSNVLNNQHYEVYGGPLIGRLAYISLNYEINKF